MHGLIGATAETRVLLGMTGEISDADRSLLTMLVPFAKAAIMDDPIYGLGYDPEYFENRIEWYPQADRQPLGADEGGYWDSNASGTKAFWNGSSRVTDLQLRHLPVRSVSQVLVDPVGGFGQKSGSFGAGTAWTAGDDYFIKLEQAGISSEGVLYALTGWPVEPGSIKVTYTSGYTTDELSGRATTGSSATPTGINAAGIKHAFLITLVKAFKTFKVQRAASGSLVAGPINSERLGDYSYSIDGAAAAALTGFQVSVPPEAGSLLHKFRNFALMLT